MLPAGSTCVQRLQVLAIEIWCLQCYHDAVLLLLHHTTDFSLTRHHSMDDPRLTYTGQTLHLQLVHHIATEQVLVRHNDTQ